MFNFHAIVFYFQTALLFTRLKIIIKLIHVYFLIMVRTSVERTHGFGAKCSTMMSVGIRCNIDIILTLGNTNEVAGETVIVYF